MMNSNGAIGCLVMNAAAGELGKLVQKNYDRFIQTNGVEWTVRRYKAIFQAALLLRQGRFEEARDQYRKNSISYNKRSLLPSGYEAALVNNFVHARRPATQKRAAAALRAYTQLRCSKPTKAQIKKTFNSINGPYTGRVPLDELSSLGRDWVISSLKSRKIRVKTLKEQPLTIAERYAHHLSPGKYYYSRDKVPRKCRHMPYASMGMSFTQESWVPRQLDEVTPGFEGREILRKDPNMDHSMDNIVGRITYIQELGAKGRVVCMPSAPLQLAFMPLHNRLDRITRSVFPKESVVTDQNYAAYQIKQHIESGGSVFSSDLSSATDRFPLEFQCGVLEGIGYLPYANALRATVRQKFVDAETGYLHSYAVGQPMGLYGSFPLFNLSHAVVVDQAIRRAEDLRNRCLKEISETYPGPPEFQRFPDGSAFFVLGDDICFSDIRFRNEYEDILEDFGVEIQSSKAHDTPCAEFAGFLAITDPETRKTNVFRPLKFTDQGYPSVICLLDAIGSKSSRLGSSPKKARWWQRQFDAYRHTISSREPDLSPILKDDPEKFRVNTYRGDLTNLKNTCQAISLLAGPDVQIPDFDLQTKGRVNRIPLFAERGLTDWYGYDPEKLVQAVREEETHPQRKLRKQASSDPLLEVSHAHSSGRQTPNDWRILLPEMLRKTSVDLNSTPEIGTSLVSDELEL